jgi:hypothetical protein
MDGNYFDVDRLPVDVALYDSVDFRFIQKAVRLRIIYIRVYLALIKCGVLMTVTLNLPEEDTASIFRIEKCNGPQFLSCP